MDLTELRQRVIRETRSLPDPPTAEDIDDAINLTQRTFIQPIARLQGISNYTTTAAIEEAAVSTIISDLYEMRFILALRSDGSPGDEIALLNEDVSGQLYVNGFDVTNFGVRLFNDTFIFQIGAARQIRLHYYKLLTDLTEGGTTTPEIPSHWHDLYWLGAAAWLYPVNQMLLGTFRDRLEQYRIERQRNKRADRRTVRTTKAWY